jgi:hypothetical protein
MSKNVLIKSVQVFVLAVMCGSQLQATIFTHRSQLPNPARSLKQTGEYAVGSTGGGGSISPAGAATYSIPIAMAPGTAGAQPTVTIGYSSQTGNGLLGYGWNLDAISSIMRTGQNVYYDGVNDGVSLTDKDNLLLNGGRLLLDAGSNLRAGARYRTEVENFLIIESKNFVSGGETFLGFEVRSREGGIQQYGSSADSYIKPKGSNVPYTWLLKKVTDINGNYFTYSYDVNHSTGKYLLKQIDYTGNEAAGLQPYSRIEFFYEPRKDTADAYIAGAYMHQSALLSSIKSIAFNTTVREYKFNYFYDGYLYKLVEVEETGQSGLKFNSTIIDWGDYANADATTEGEYTLNLPAQRIPGYRADSVFTDFNSDGLTDFMVAHSPRDIKVGQTDTAVLWLASRDASGNTVSSNRRYTLPLEPGYTKTVSLDLNGDGLTDMITIAIRGANYYYQCYLFDGERFIKCGNRFYSSSSESMAGDFDGDGKQEILIKEENILCGLSSFTSNTIQITQFSGIDWSEKDITKPNQYELINFDGSDRNYLMITDIDGFRIYRLDGSAFSQVYSGSNFTNSSIKLIADFNGDGHMDILVKNGINNFFILYGTGKGFDRKSLDISKIPAIPQWSIVDFNRDGKPDILINTFKGGTVFTFSIGLFNGNGFTWHDYRFNLPVFVDEQSAWSILHFTDFNGDGYPEMTYSGGNALLVKTFNIKQNLHVKQIVNGLNGKVSFEYRALTDPNCYEQSETPDSYPVKSFRPAMFVATAQYTQAGNLCDTVYHHYKGLQVHLRGKGAIGFEEQTVTSLTANTKTTARYGINPDYFYQYPISQIVTTIAGDSLTRADFETGCFTIAPKTYFPYVKKQTSIDYLTGLTSQTESFYSLSDNGYPHRVIQNTGNLIIETESEYGAINSPYKNKLLRKIVTHRGIGKAFTSSEAYEYDAAGRLIKTISMPGHATETVTEYTNFNAFGMALSTTVSATYDSSCPTVTASSTVDATGRFTLSSTNALGQTSYAEYDPVIGAVLRETGIDGLSVSYEYDGFGATVKKTTPLDTVTTSVEWEVSGDILYKATTESKVSGEVVTWYNRAGQAVRTQSPGFEGKTSPQSLR